MGSILARKNIRYTKQLLEHHVQNVTSFAALLRSLGLRDVGGNYRHVQGRCRYFMVDTSHFTGPGWSKGLTLATSQIVAVISQKLTTPFAEQFCENSKAKSSSVAFRRTVIANGIAYRCAHCGGDATWNGKPLKLDLDHINGISNDNRLINLRFLCPNCHRQTPTWGNTNGKRRLNLVREGGLEPPNPAV